MKKFVFFTILIIISVILIALRGFFLNSFYEVPEITALKNKKITIIAHRGASGHAPENTLAAFSKALEMESDVIELDIHLSKDGEVVVIHDATVDRTTDGFGLVNELTLPALKKFDAGKWYGEDFTGEKIPTLKESLQLINGKAKALIEIKTGSDGYIYTNIEKKTIEIVKELDAMDWCIIQSFEPYYLQTARKYSEEIEIQRLLFSDFSPFPFFSDTSLKAGDFVEHEVRYTAINPHFMSLTKGKVATLHERGFKTFPYTVNKADEMKKLMAMGVDGIITNYPDVLKSILDDIP
ncbi:glycerophosphodiester phosphodiesterase [Flexithrix dorotheae]|uniref:glycerophosphodiester phosphodiesterase n=1 Tax=Flexithrix dorotheae TaxID=70993 RepID=UPI00037A4D1B|nr:glycerophosphodiester phosphodiesterase family protein [Flexithrix dorotheae]